MKGRKSARLPPEMGKFFWSAKQIRFGPNSHMAQANVEFGKGVITS